MAEVPESLSTAIYEAIYETLSRMEADDHTPSMTINSQEEEANIPGTQTTVSIHDADTLTPTSSGNTSDNTEDVLVFNNLDKLNAGVFPPNELFQCPLWYDCDWLGFKKDIYTHCHSEHSQSIYESGTWFACATNASGKYIVHDKGNIFFLFVEKKQAGHLIYDVQYLAKTNDFISFAFELIQKDVPSMVIRRKLGYVEKYSGRIRNRPDNIFAGDYFRFIFREIPVQEMKCRRCNEVMKDTFLVDRVVWACDKCPHRIKSCSNWFNGCVFVDFPAKVKSHERLFCHFNKRCLFCPINGLNINECSLLSHYYEHHKQLLRRSFFTYSTSENYVTTLINVQQCLLAVECKMKRANVLRVMIFMEYISALSRYYKLYVKVKDPRTDVEKMFPTKLVHYSPDNYGADWFLRINIEREFPNWSGKFIIDITMKRKLLSM